MKWAKRIAMIAIALAILGAVVYGFLPKPVECEFAKVTRGDIRETIDEEGRTRVRDRFTISAPVTGVISRLVLKAGDAVQTGDVITVLAPGMPPLLDARAKAQAEANVKSSEASLKQAEANETAAMAEHDLAVKTLANTRKLFASKHVSQEQVDVAETREHSAAAALDSAKFGKQAAGFQLEMAKAALVGAGLAPPAGDASIAPTGIAIKSPVNGRVLRVFRQSEGPVQPGEMLVEIGDPASLEIVADVLSVDAVRVRPGMKVSIERWGGPEALAGVVRVVEPGGFTKISSLGVEEQRVNVIIDFVGAGLAPPAGDASIAPTVLGDGYRVETRIITSEFKDVVKVPIGALFKAEGGDALFVVVDDVATRRVIKIGARNGLEAEVLTGLNAGDQVIVHPGDDVSDGRAVVER